MEIPKKFVQMGRAWPPKDLADLTKALIVIAKENDNDHALELLSYGFARTMMTEEQFRTIVDAILKANK